MGQQNLRKETMLDNVNNNPSKRGNTTPAVAVTPTMGPPTASEYGAPGIINMAVAPVEAVAPVKENAAEDSAAAATAIPSQNPVTTTTTGTGGNAIPITTATHYVNN